MSEPPDTSAKKAGREGISVFFPAYNDEASIAALVRDALEVLPRITDDYEVVVVNDGSRDRTSEVLDALSRTNPRVRVVHHETNRGYGGALRTGFASASKELVFYTDGDGQYDVRELVSLRPLLTERVDIVNGYKLKRADEWERKALGAIYNRLAHILFSIPIRDVDCDFRLIRARALQKVKLSSTSGSICVELVYKLHRAGCKFAEAPVNHYQRAHGRSQFFRFSRVARTALDLLSLWTNLVILNRRDRRQRTAAPETTSRSHTSSEH